ncbi:MAG: hypothetical protein PHD54_03945 [Desulfuromonadaceae bacterium]|nr:hypothetical protein [Desulfuromonadaceae bacterium]
MLKYLLFIMFFSGMVLGYMLLHVPTTTPYDEMLTLVWQGMSLVLIGGIGSIVCLFKITR